MIIKLTKVTKNNTFLLLHNIFYIFFLIISISFAYWEYNIFSVKLLINNYSEVNKFWRYRYILYVKLKIYSIPNSEILNCIDRKNACSRSNKYVYDQLIKYWYILQSYDNWTIKQYVIANLTSNRWKFFHLLSHKLGEL